MILAEGRFTHTAYIASGADRFYRLRRMNL
jgi:hypothetical protein